MFGFFKKKAPAAQDAKPQQPNEALLVIAQQSLSNAMQSNEAQAIAQAQAQAQAEAQAQAQAQAQAEIQAEALADEDLAQQALAAAAEEATDIQANASNADSSAPEQPSQTEPAGRAGWFNRLKSGLKKTGNSISAVFGVTQIDDALYEDLEAALLMADAGVQATEFLLADLKRRVKATGTTEPAQVKKLLVDAIADLLTPP